jgi:hypothetical protein
MHLHAWEFPPEESQPPDVGALSHPAAHRLDWKQPVSLNPGAWELSVMCAAGIAFGRVRAC